MLQRLLDTILPGRREAREVATLRHQLEKRALETQLSFYDNLVDPREPYFDDPGFAPRLGYDGLPGAGQDDRKRGDSLPVYTDETQLKVIRDRGRRLAAENEFGINAVTNRTAFTVGTGFSYRVVRKGAKHAVPTVPKPEDNLVRAAQDYIDEFIARTAWGEREQEAWERCDNDGEAPVRFFPLLGGRVDVRFVAPEHITDTTGRPNHSYGVVTDPRDTETIWGYSVIEDSVTRQTEFVEEEDILHIKLNTRSTCKRGLPTLYPVRKNLERAERLLRNMSVLAATQSNFAMIRKHKRMKAGVIDGFRQAQADAQTTSLFGQTKYVKQYGPGTIIDTGEDTEYEFPAMQIDAGSMVAVLQADLRAVASRLVLAEYMLTGDASNGNYSSLEMAESPPTKNFLRLQAFAGRRFGQGGYTRGPKCGVMWRVLQHGVRAGRLEPETLTELEIQAEGPSLVTRDTLKETQRNKVLSDAGLLSDATWSQREELDREQELGLGAQRRATPPPTVPGMPPVADPAQASPAAA
jgi:hypothetical protein